MEGTTVSVMALFRRGELIPKAIRYASRTILLERVTLKYRTKDAGLERWFFNVQSVETLHTLVYEPATWRWRLVASWDAPDEAVS